MKIEDMMKLYTGKYVGELDTDYVRDVDCDLAKSKFLMDEYMEGICLELDALKGSIKRYFDTMRAGMSEKAERFALDVNTMSHDLVHDMLVVWTLSEALLPKD